MPKPSQASEDNLAPAFWLDELNMLPCQRCEAIWFLAAGLTPPIGNHRRIRKKERRMQALEAPAQ